jgi:hypothetical protein
MSKPENKVIKGCNILDVNVKNYGRCDYCADPDNIVTLNLSWEIWSQWLYISQKMGSKEWGCVFWVKDNTITHFRIPKQEVTSTECEFKEELGGNGIMHSHHNMSAFHSLQDDQHARNLYDYSIVMSNSNGYEATKRVKIPCGGFSYVKVELLITGCPETDLMGITEKRTDLIPETHHPTLALDSDCRIGDTACDRCATRSCENCQLLDMAYMPCDKCESLKCNECRFFLAGDARETLPFCEYCMDYQDCESCPKIARYLENYPEEQGQFEYLNAD